MKLQDNKIIFVNQCDVMAVEWILDEMKKKTITHDIFSRNQFKLFRIEWYKSINDIKRQ